MSSNRFVIPETHVLREDDPHKIVPNIEEEDEDEEEQSQEEESSLSAHVQPRPARASLTHHAIKTELMKMNKQQREQQQKMAELAIEGDDDQLSRAARKRKRRREKVLEERRLSGRSEDLDDDFANFKSVSIARRRSSILPVNAVFHHHEKEGGVVTYPAPKTSCWSWISSACWWILILGLLFGGLYYLLPMLNDVDNAALAQQSSGQPQVDAVAADSFSAAASSMADNINEETTGTGAAESPIDEESVSSATVRYILELGSSLLNSLLLPESTDEIAGDALGNDAQESNNNNNNEQAEQQQHAQQQNEAVKNSGNKDEEAGTVEQQQSSFGGWFSGGGIGDDDAGNNEEKTNDSVDDDDDDESTEKIELDIDSAKTGVHLETDVSDEDQLVNNQADDDDEPADEGYGWFWSTTNTMAAASEETNDNINNENADIDDNDDKVTVAPSADEFTTNFYDEADTDNQAVEDRFQQMQRQMEFDEQEARQFVENLNEQDKQLEELKVNRQHLQQPNEPEIFECGMSLDIDGEPGASANIEGCEKKTTETHINSEFRPTAEYIENKQSGSESVPASPSASSDNANADANQENTNERADQSPYYDDFFYY